MAELLPSLAEDASILVVDDQPVNVELVAEILSMEGYRIRTAHDGLSALAAVEEDLPDCIVLDVMMPRLDGYETCRRLKSERRTNFVPVVMLTALSSVDDKVASFDAGADDFLNKPVHSSELRARVRSMVRIKRLRDELDTSESIVVSMINALERRDAIQAGHSRRVAHKSVRLARELGLAPEEIERIGKGALLHDLGKLGVSERLLELGESALEGEELETYRQHPILGERILRPLRSLEGVLPIIRHHHERLDGGGYPDGIAGSELDLMTEIVAVANLHDHLAGRYDSPGVAELMRGAASAGQYHRDLVEDILRLGPSVSVQPEKLTDWMGRLPTRQSVRTGKILVADDALANRAVLREILERAGHDVVTVESGSAALRSFRDERPDLVLLDVHMPDVDGFEACREIKSHRENEFVPVVLLTAKYDLLDRSASAAAGADDFLLYPVNRLELVSRINSLLRLRQYFRDLEEYQSVILSLASALEAKDPYTRGHSERVGFLATKVAAQLGRSEAESEGMLVAGLLHDIGKIGVPQALLNKPGRLTEGEFEQIMEHPVIGEEICRPLRSARAALPLIRHHHERYDGSGYPDHLVGNSIPLGARIMGVADAFDALTSARPYRRGLDPKEALEILESETRRGRWDPKVFAALEAVVQQSGA